MASPNARRPDPTPSRRLIQTISAAALVAAAGTGLLAASADATGVAAAAASAFAAVPEQSPARAITGADAAAAAATFAVPAQEARTARVVQAPDPVAIRIPAIQVAAEVVPLGVVDGEIEVPQDFAQTGWWRDGPEPGEPGSSVILGHVDSFDGPAVFFAVRDLQAGERILVDRQDGSTVVYEVTLVEQHDKESFPTDRVYEVGGDASLLRLVTCGGGFDAATRSYDANVIVFARQLGTA